MRLLNVLVIIGIIALMFAGQSFYKADLETGETRDIYNFTESSIKWDQSYYNESLYQKIPGEIGSEEYKVNIERFRGILDKFIDFVGFGFTELTKWSIEYGYNHPEHDLKFFLDILIKILYVLLAIAIIPLVVPLLALVYLIFKGIFWVFKRIFGVRDD